MLVFGIPFLAPMRKQLTPLSEHLKKLSFPSRIVCLFSKWADVSIF